MFTLKSIENIKNEIIRGNIQTRNFPKSITFPLDELYKEIVTKIKTTEISSECILYDSIESNNITNELSDKNYWVIGQNGQGDYWIMDINHKIYYYNHDIEEIIKENFVDLNITFGKWLQFAFLDKELDKIYDENKYNKNVGKEYMEKLKEISLELNKNYPFEIE
jgi:hypothetical protein